MTSPTDVRLAVYGIVLRRICRALAPSQAVEVATGLRDDLLGLLAALGGPLDAETDEALAVEAHRLLDVLKGR